MIIDAPRRLVSAFSADFTVFFASHAYENRYKLNTGFLCRWSSVLALSHVGQ